MQQPRVHTYQRPGSKCWYFRYRDAKGQLVRRSSGTTDAAEARRLADRLEITLGHRQGGDQLYDEVAAAYVESRSTGTRANWQAQLRRWDEFLRGKFLTEITEEDISRFVARRHRQKVTDATIRSGLAYLSGLLTYAGVPRNRNVVKLYSKKELKAARKVVRFLLPEEEQRLLEACRLESQRHLVIFAIETGLRMREQTHLKPWQVSRQKRELLIPAEGAKDRQPRIVPLSDRALAVLDAAGFNPRAEWVFTSALGRPYENMHYWWGKVQDRAGVRCRWHDLRHTFASRWLRDGGTLATLSRVLGHSNITLTMRYAHLVTADLHREVERLDRVRRESFKQESALSPHMME